MDKEDEVTGWYLAKMVVLMWLFYSGSFYLFANIFRLGDLADPWFAFAMGGILTFIGHWTVA